MPIPPQATDTARAIQRAIAAVRRQWPTLDHESLPITAIAEACEHARIQRGDRVLDIGTGSGFQAAVLVQLGAEVDSVELDEVRARSATQRLSERSDSIRVHCTDGITGLPQHAPFDAIIVGGAVERVPDAWFDQLKPGGRLVVPVGTPTHQELVVWYRQRWGIDRRRVGAVAYEMLTVRSEAPSDPP